MFENDTYKIPKFRKKEQTKMGGGVWGVKGYGSKTFSSSLQTTISGYELDPVRSAPLYNKAV